MLIEGPELHRSLLCLVGLLELNWLLPADALLIDELIPDNPRVVGLGGEEIDAAFDHHSHPLLEALALHQDGAQCVLHSRERKVKDSKVDLLLGAKMMEQRRGLDADARRDITQARAAVAALGEQTLPDLEDTLARIGSPMQLDH